MSGPARVFALVLLTLAASAPARAADTVDSAVFSKPGVNVGETFTVTATGSADGPGTLRFVAYKTTNACPGNAPVSYPAGEVVALSDSSLGQGAFATERPATIQYDPRAIREPIGQYRVCAFLLRNGAVVASASAGVLRVGGRDTTPLIIGRWLGVMDATISGVEADESPIPAERISWTDAYMEDPTDAPSKATWLKELHAGTHIRLTRLGIHVLTWTLVDSGGQEIRGTTHCAGPFGHCGFFFVSMPRVIRRFKAGDYGYAAVLDGGDTRFPGAPPTVEVETIRKIAAGIWRSRTCAAAAGRRRCQTSVTKFEATTNNPRFRPAVIRLPALLPDQPVRVTVDLARRDQGKLNWQSRGHGSAVVPGTPRPSGAHSLVPTIDLDHWQHPVSEDAWKALVDLGRVVS